MRLPDQPEHGPVFVVASTVERAERWARDRGLPPSAWRVVVRSRDEERLRGRYGGQIVVLNGAHRNRAASDLIRCAERQGMTVTYENQLCRHHPPCAPLVPSFCFNPEYIAAISAALAKAFVGVDELHERPGLVARITEYRAPVARVLADKRDECGCHRGCTTDEHKCPAKCRWPDCLTDAEARALAEEIDG